VGDEDVCVACGDLKDSAGNCYTCSDEHIELRKDFKFEYAFEHISEKHTLFRNNPPEY